MVISVDLSPIVQAIVVVAAAAVPIICGYIANLIKKKIGIQQGTADAALIDGAVGRAGGIAYSYLVNATAGPIRLGLRNAALEQGISHIQTALPETLARVGIDGDTLKRMVVGELGKLEAADPGVTISTKTPTQGTP